MVNMEPTRATQVAQVRNENGSAEIAVRGALQTAGVDVGDVIAFASQRDPPLVTATKIDGSMSVDQPTRKVRRRHTIAIPAEFYELLDVTGPAEADADQDLGTVVAYATDGTGSIAIGTDSGPAIEPVTVGE